MLLQQDQALRISIDITEPIKTLENHLKHKNHALASIDYLVQKESEQKHTNKMEECNKKQTTLNKIEKEGI